MPKPAFFRTVLVPLQPSTPADFLRYHLPDTLWFLSAILFLRFLWFYKAKTQTAYIVCFYGIAFALEIIQLSEKVPGTFDWLDLLFMGIGAFVEGLLYKFVFNKECIMRKFLFVLFFVCLVFSGCSTIFGPLISLIANNEPIDTDKLIPDAIPCPSLAELREINGNNNKLVVFFCSGYDANVTIVADRPSIALMMAYSGEISKYNWNTSYHFNKRKELGNELDLSLREGGAIELESDNHYRSGNSPVKTTAAYSFGANVSEVGLYRYNPNVTVGGSSQPGLRIQMDYFRLSNKKEQFYVLELNRVSEITDTAVVERLLARRGRHSYAMASPDGSSVRSDGLIYAPTR